MRQQPSLFPHTPSSILLAYSEHSISDMGICHKFSISQHNYPIMVFTDVKIGLVEIYFKDLPACCSISGNMEGKTVHSTFKFELLHEFANVNKYPSLFKNFDVKTCHSEK